MNVKHMNLAWDYFFDLTVCVSLFVWRGRDAFIQYQLDEVVLVWMGTTFKQESWSAHRSSKGGVGGVEVLLQQVAALFDAVFTTQSLVAYLEIPRCRPIRIFTKKPFICKRTNSFRHKTISTTGSYTMRRLTCTLNLIFQFTCFWESTTAW